MGRQVLGLLNENLEGMKVKIQILLRCSWPRDQSSLNAEARPQEMSLYLGSILKIQT